MFLLFLFLFLLRMLSPSKGCSPLGIRLPVIFSYIRVVKADIGSVCCLRLQLYFYPGMVATGLGRRDGLRHS